MAVGCNFLLMLHVVSTCYYWNSAGLHKTTSAETDLLTSPYLGACGELFQQISSTWDEVGKPTSDVLSFCILYEEVLPPGAFPSALLTVA